MLTAIQLRDRLDAICEKSPTAKVYGYFGADGILIQVEPVGTPSTVLLRCPAAAPSSGGEAE